MTSLITQDDELSALYYGWTIIANVSEGDWTKQSPEWQQAAAKFRSQLHDILNHHKIPAEKVL